MGGTKFLKGGDIPRRFAPLGGDIPRRFAGGGEYPRHIAPLLRGGANLLGGRISCDTGRLGNNEDEQEPGTFQVIEHYIPN